jgi:hypothetical protein
LAGAIRASPVTPSATATATSKAALDDRPTPTGTVDDTSPSNPVVAPIAWRTAAT